MSEYRLESHVSHNFEVTVSEPSSRKSSKKSHGSKRSGKSNLGSKKTQKVKSSDRKPPPKLRKIQLKKETAAPRQSVKKFLWPVPSETATWRSLSRSQSVISHLSNARSRSLLSIRLQDIPSQTNLYTIQKAKVIDKSKEKPLPAEQKQELRRTHSLISGDLEIELLDGRLDVEESAEEIVIEEDITGIQYRQQMINALREIPDIADISESDFDSISDKTKPMPEKSVRKRKQLTIKSDKKDPDKGGFVDAVTEEESSDTDTDTDDQTVNEVDNTDATTSNTISTSMLSFSDIDEKFLPPVQPTPYQLAHAKSEEIQHVIDDMIRQTDDVWMLEDEEAAAREIYGNMCRQFIDDLVDTVVTKYEEHHSALRALLDKEKLLDALQLLVLDLCDQRIMRDQLGRMIAEHFSRRKKFVYISKVNFFDSLNYQRFQMALAQLDKNLLLKKHTEIKVKDSVNELREELNERVYYSEQKIEDFENLLRTTLIKNENYHRLDNLITYQLKLMAKLRDDLSDMRLELFCMQHRYADIQLQSQALNDLSGGLKISEFIMQQAETNALSDKINDRNMELSRMHNIVNYNTHALAHIKCKATMIRKQLRGMRFKLDVFERKRLYYRGLSYRAQISHNNTIREINRMKMSSPLMFFPLLLQDYDETLSTLRVRQKYVNQLRIEYDELMQRIRAADRRIHGSGRANIWHHVELPKQKPLQLFITAMSTE